MQDPSWGNNPRFLRLDLLHESLQTAIRNKIQSSEPKFTSETHWNAFLRGIHKIAFESRSADPVGWAFQHLPYFLPLVPLTLKAFDKPEQFIDLYYIDALDVEYEEVFKKTNTATFKQLETLEKELRKRYTMAGLYQEKIGREEVRTIIDNSVDTSVFNKIQETFRTIKENASDSQTGELNIMVRRVLRAINVVKIAEVFDANKARIIKDSGAS
jgi:hypothetical protein